MNTQKANTGEQKVVDYSYQSFKGENIMLMPANPKTYLKDKGEQGKYQEVPILCNYGTPEKPYAEKGWSIEYSCGVWTDGLRTSEKEYTKKMKNGDIEKHKIVTYQAKVTFDQRETKQMDLVRKLDEGHLAIARVLLEKQYNGGLGIRGLDCATNFKAENTGLKRLVYYPRDNKTNEVTPGINFSQFLNLRGTPNSERHTIFIGLDGQEVPWEILMKCDFFWIPMVTHSHLYSSNNGTVSIQHKVGSGIVLKLKPRDGAEKQNQTLKRLQTMDPKASSDFAAQIAALTNLNSQDFSDQDEKSKDEKSVNPSADPPKEQESNQPAPIDKLQGMASGGQYSPPLEQGQQGIQSDPQGKPDTNIQIPAAGQQYAQNTTPQQGQQNTTPQQGQQYTVAAGQQYAQNTTPQQGQQYTAAPNTAPQQGQQYTVSQQGQQYNPNTAAHIPIIPPPSQQYQVNNSTPSIPQNQQPYSQGPPSLPGGIPGVPSVGAPQIRLPIDQ
uniref:Topoisomerase II-associated protein n=1 Tax=Pithovirus LCPAC201 TaxID=2506591 RepID=A0A481Z748_9VIRU|nr:MAG: topoisomerase II-associated protein [Pithovirus LCPAC201]